MIQKMLTENEVSTLVAGRWKDAWSLVRATEQLIYDLNASSLQRDSERLDWPDRVMDLPVSLFDGTYVNFSDKGLREVIDLAMLKHAEVSAAMKDKE